MRKPLMLVVTISLLILGGWTLNYVMAQANRLCVCHLENTKSGAGHVIEVDEHSLQGHLRHGDKQCGVDCDDILNKRCNISTGSQCSDTGR